MINVNKFKLVNYLKKVLAFFSFFWVEFICLVMFLTLPFAWVLFLYTGNKNCWWLVHYCTRDKKQIKNNNRIKKQTVK